MSFMFVTETLIDVVYVFFVKDLDNLFEFLSLVQIHSNASFSLFSLWCLLIALDLCWRRFPL